MFIIIKLTNFIKLTIFFNYVNIIKNYEVLKLDTFNHTNVKNSNRFEIVKYIYRNEDVNRKQLATKLNLTGAAITKIINSLIEEEILEEENYFSKIRNRKARYLKITEKKFGLITLHFQRNSTRLAICDICGKILYIKNFTKVLDLHDITIIKGILQMGLDNFDKSMKLLACVCITPGIQEFSNSNKKINPYYWDLKELRDYVVNNLNIEFISENDSNCALLGETCFGCAKQSKNVVLYNIGQGIGAAAIINSTLHKSYNNGAIEIGHVTIDHNGAYCSCGNRGCLEIYTSIPDWNKKIQKELDSEKENLMEEFFIKYGTNDQTADFYVNEYSKFIAEGALILANLFSPKQLILTNNEADFINFKPIIKTIEETISNRMYQIRGENNIKISQSVLQSNGYLLGSIIFCLSYYFKNDLF